MSEVLRPLRADERALLDCVLESDVPGSALARSQVDFALYAGKSHEGEDQCFDIAVEGDVALIQEVPPSGLSG